ncbi:hypothetical protein GCM10009853_056920 [Glycomyces scopariae]
MPETVPAGDPRGPGPDAAPEPDDAPPTRSDPELIAATRRGDTTAYAVLYERHVHAARRLSRILSRDPAGADDLVSETFAKLLHTFRDGGGPDLAFRPYMLQTLRNTFYDRVRRDKKVEFTDDLSPHDAGETFVDPAVEGQERRYAALAFGKLPERWRMVLWHTEVEEDSPAKIATMLGMTPNGVSALAYRAREKLRQNYLTEHAADSPREECRWTVDRLGARVRGKLGERDVQKVDDHLDSCVTCNLLFAELTELNSGLRGVVAVVFLGGSAAPYLAAGTASAAGLAVGGFLAFVGAPFVAAANWIRRIVQQLGTKGSLATGTAVAVVAAVAVFALTSGEDEEEPQAAPDEPAVTAPAGPGPEPDPEDPEPEPEDPAPEDPDDPAPSPDPEDPAEEPAPGAEPAAYGIAHGLGTSGLVAGGDAVLPIRLEAPEGAGGAYAPATERVAESARESAPTGHGQAPATDRVTLDIAFPEGVTLAAETAEPGWTCVEADTVQCSIAKLPDPAEANVHIRIGADVSGYQTFTVTVEGPGISGTTALQVPIAPAGSTVGYASLDATGVTASGNTWMTCSVPGCRDAALLGAGDRWPMKAYKPDDAPAGREGEAASGARLDVPSGATVKWAGLYWAGVHEDLPTDVALHGPGGTWAAVTADALTDTSPGVQAFADVTGLVTGGGDYWVATDNHQLPTSPCKAWPIDAGAHCLEPHWAGWSLTVVYAQPGADAREVAVYDGAAAEDTAIEIENGGEVDIAATLWGGSAYRRGDALTAGGQDLGDPATCTANGALNNPGWYAFGVDVQVHRAHTGEAAAIRFERGDDPFIVGVVAVAQPAAEP